MGKSGGRKKKGGGDGSKQVNKSSANTGSSDSDASIYLNCALKLKEEGNKKFAGGDYVGALENYFNGLKLIPENHPDRAVFHSNRAACLMQMNPIDHDNVIEECSFALKVQPGFTRALDRRARAFEAVGKYEMALQDVNALLGADPNHKDATEMAQRLASVMKEKELETDDWLFEFSKLFRSHVGIDPDAHLDLHDLGVELCSKAIEETVTSEEAQPLFDKAAAHFQEVAALALVDWGNVHMCSANKRMIPPEELSENETVAEQLRTDYEWMKQRYTLAKEKYEHALSIKPGFYEGLRALAQQQFEMAKLHWSFVSHKIDDSSDWDPTETLELFESAQEKMKAATEMWEKMNDLSTHGDGENGEALEAVTAEQVKIHMLWGDMLFERSQVECKFGVDGWKKNLDSAVERFKLAGASKSEISALVKNHCSHEVAAEGDEKKVAKS